MNYPIQGLVVIAPILFMVLIIAIPTIGVFAGWKRAAYWGGGTFFFFVVGAIVWAIAGNSIANKIAALIPDIQGAKINPSLIKSAAAPIFFLIVTLLAEIILVINYYTWFKKVAKIKKDIATKREMKSLKKQGRVYPKKEWKKLSKWGAMQFTTKGQIINKVCGGVGLGLLIAPSTVSGTQALYYLTTNSTTRANAKFAKGLYDQLQRTAKAFSWMSYYDGKQTGTNCDSLISLVELGLGDEISYQKLTDAGELVDAKGKPIAAFSDIMHTGMAAVIKASAPSNTKEDLDKAINNWGTTWNNLMKNKYIAFTALFGADDVADMFKTIISKQTKTTIEADAIIKSFGTTDVPFWDAMRRYFHPSEREEFENPLKAIKVSNKAWTSLYTALRSLFTITSSTEQAEGLLSIVLTYVVQMMFI